MAGIKIDPVIKGGMELKAEGTTVYISGCVNHPSPGMFIEPFITEVHNKILEKKIKEIVVNITDLRFLNSAGIRELVDWVMKLSALEEGKKYKIKFLCSSEYQWQESSMTTLVYLSPECTSKETANPLE
ncbi:MAG: hypothetical protein JXB88_07760 [Spirochaetales bacterium]|nr:hypothetical protein [Spirochaetales bacterium]